MKHYFLWEIFSITRVFSLWNSANLWLHLLTLQVYLLIIIHTFFFFFFASIFYSLSEKICLYSSFCRMLSIFSIIIIEIELNENTYLLHISLDERSDGLLVCCGREGGKYMGGFVRWLAVVGITSLLGNRPSG